MFCFTCNHGISSTCVQDAENVFARSVQHFCFRCNHSFLWMRRSWGCQEIWLRERHVFLTLYLQSSLLLSVELKWVQTVGPTLKWRMMLSAVDIFMPALDTLHVGQAIFRWIPRHLAHYYRRCHMKLRRINLPITLTFTLTSSFFTN